MNPDPRRTKALAILREGRLTVLHAREHALDITEVIARVQSSREGGPNYAVDYLDGIWACTCNRREACAHIHAAQLVTGHAPSLVPA